MRINLMNSQDEKVIGGKEDEEKYENIYVSIDNDYI